MDVQNKNKNPKKQNKKYKTMATFEEAQSNLKARTDNVPSKFEVITGLKPLPLVGLCGNPGHPITKGQGAPFNL